MAPGPSRMWWGRHRTMLTQVTSILPLIDPALVGPALALWTWAGLRAAALPTAVTPRELADRAGDVLVLIVVALALGLLHAGLLIASTDGASGPRIALLVAGLGTGLLTVGTSVPRLIALRRTAGAFFHVSAMPPLLRYGAAHPLVAWPVQVSAYAGAAALAGLFLTAYPPGWSLAICAIGAAAFTWHHRWLAHARHASAVLTGGGGRGGVPTPERRRG